MSSKELPERGYLKKKGILSGVVALKKCMKQERSSSKRKNLLDDGSAKVIIEVVFKSIPSNSKTYIHTTVLPNHWRLKLEPEDCDIALFVRHRRPENEAQKIQFSRDRDLDIENTHSYYKNLFEKKLDESIRSRISRIITTKELATEFNTFQKLDRLSKTYELFLSDKQLMANKMNPLPRRLGRRFWVREKKVPLMVRLDAKTLNERFVRALKTEPFYVLGRSATEHIQVGVTSQPVEDIVENIQAFLNKLYDLYDDGVRFIRLKTDKCLPLPLYADLDPACPKVVMRKRRVKTKPIIDDFDMLDEDAKVAVYRSGAVKVMREKRKRLSANTSTAEDKPVKKMRKSIR